MSSTRSNDTVPPAPPRRKLTYATSFTYPKSSKSLGDPKSGAHGMLLALAFMILFPAGSLGLVLGLSFWAHVGIQLAGALSCFAGVALQVWPMASAGRVR